MSDPGAASETGADASPRVYGGGRARALARDFLLIVTRVLTALALENWNAEYKEHRLEAEYLRTLAAR